MKDEALKLALEALLRSRKAVAGDYDLASCAYGSNDPDGHRYQDAKKTVESVKEAITAIKQALAAPAQMIVANMTVEDRRISFAARILADGTYDLYTTPPNVATPPVAQREWVGLTDEEIERSYETAGHYQTLRPQDRFAVFALARAIEAKLKERNTS